MCIVYYVFYNMRIFIHISDLKCTRNENTDYGGTTCIQLQRDGYRMKFQKNEWKFISKKSANNMRDRPSQSVCVCRTTEIDSSFSLESTYKLILFIMFYSPFLVACSFLSVHPHERNGCSDSLHLRLTHTSRSSTTDQQDRLIVMADNLRDCTVNYGYEGQSDVKYTFSWS